LRSLREKVDFSCFRYHPYLESRLTIQEKSVLGTIITFFPWELVARGRLGVGETQETASACPSAQLATGAVASLREAPRTRPSISGETVLSFKDPDGMRLALVAIPGAESASVDQWRYGGRSRDPWLAQRDLLLRDDAPTGAIVTGLFGFLGSEKRDRLCSIASRHRRRWPPRRFLASRRVLPRTALATNLRTQWLATLLFKRGGNAASACSEIDSIHPELLFTPLLTFAAFLGLRTCTELAETLRALKPSGS
jgi:catechol 2,3-dioxygenase-like lactoylglutathione lyase family enzyme